MNTDSVLDEIEHICQLLDRQRFNVRPEILKGSPACEKPRQDARVCQGRKVHFDCAQYRGLLEDLPICPCEHLDLGLGWYREDVPVRRRLVAYWQRGQLEALLLATNVAWMWRRIVKTFQLRMMIEELFRDEKNIRYGWSLRQFVATSPARLERLFLVLILAYLLLLLFGLRCLETFSSAHWAASSSKKRRQTSAFVVARLMLPSHAVSITLLLRLLVRLLGNPSIRNWG